MTGDKTRAFGSCKDCQFAEPRINIKYDDGFLICGRINTKTTLKSRVRDAMEPYTGSARNVDRVWWAAYYAKLAWCYSLELAVMDAAIEDDDETTFYCKPDFGCVLFEPRP